MIADDFACIMGGVAAAAALMRPEEEWPLFGNNFNLYRSLFTFQQRSILSQSVYLRIRPW